MFNNFEQLLMRFLFKLFFILTKIKMYFVLLFAENFRFTQK